MYFVPTRSLIFALFIFRPYSNSTVVARKLMSYRMLVEKSLSTDTIVLTPSPLDVVGRRLVQPCTTY